MRQYTKLIFQDVVRVLLKKKDGEEKIFYSIENVDSVYAFLTYIKIESMNIPLDRYFLFQILLDYFSIFWLKNYF